MAHAIGITNVKAVLVSSQGALVASAARALATRRSGDGEVAEQDAEALWPAVKESIA
jgi:sugar (pentulose or hexulose) kinase